MGPISRALTGGRLHFQHGPIDIVAYAQGDPAQVRSAHDDAWRRFSTVLAELVTELAALRTAVGAQCALRGDVARTMWDACHRCAEGFITPMAAVAGSVAQALIASYDRPGIERAWVNNGGDIALHLTEGHPVRVGLFADIARLDETMLQTGIRSDGVMEIDAAMGVRGVATSGWRGRSHSLGVADSVTVLASTAALADAAATVIANAVNVEDPSIVRRPAASLKDDSDLGVIPVTVDVPALDPEKISFALTRGLELASRLRAKGLILECVLTCQGWWVSTQCSNVTRIARPD